MSLNLSSVRGISFDAAFTLLQPHPSVGHIYARVAAEKGYGDLDPAQVNRNFALSWRSRRNFDYSEGQWFLLVQQSLEGLLARSCDETLFRALYDAFRDPSCWLVYRDVRTALEFFEGRGIPMVVTSNWDTRLRQLMNDLDLSRFFREIIVSAEVGYHKPDRRIFELSCLKLGCIAPEVLHVGDTVKEDIAGAEEAGLQALLIDRASNEVSVAKIHSLENLTNLFQKGIVNKPD